MAIDPDAEPIHADETLITLEKFVEYTGISVDELAARMFEAGYEGRKLEPIDLGGYRLYRFSELLDAMGLDFISGIY